MYPILTGTQGTVDESSKNARSLFFAGLHLIVELWESVNLDDPDIIGTALRDASNACGATLLDLFLHQFQPCGVTGVAVLAESHISVHTWPERRYAAVDIFTCGRCDPYRAIPVLEHWFHPRRIQLTEQKRGVGLREENA